MGRNNGTLKDPNNNVSSSQRRSMLEWREPCGAGRIHAPFFCFCFFDVAKGKISALIREERRSSGEERKVERKEMGQGRQGWREWRGQGTRMATTGRKHDDACADTDAAASRGSISTLESSDGDDKCSFSELSSARALALQWEQHQESFYSSQAGHDDNLAVSTYDEICFLDSPD